MPSSIEELTRRAALLETTSMEKSMQQDDLYDHDDPSSSEYESSESDCSSSSSCLSSADEKKFMSMLPKTNQQMKRGASMPNFQEEMSTMQVAILLNQVRVKDEEQKREQKQQKCKTGRRHSMTSGPNSNMSTASAPTKLVDRNLPHIQGTGMEASVVSSCTVEDAPGDPSDLYFDILIDAGYEPRTLKFEDTNSFFMKVTADRMNSYSKDIIGAVRNADLNFLRMAHFDMNRNMNCCNRFGESVLHTACRHSNIESVTFLLEEAKVDLRVRDDFGRTPCHDAAWQGVPNMELVEMILLYCPDLLLIADKRGFTPLQYVRKAQWGAWNEILKKNKDKILPKQLLKPKGPLSANTFIFESAIPGFSL